MDKQFIEDVTGLGLILHETKKECGPTGNLSIQYSHCPPSEDWGEITVSRYSKEERDNAREELENMYRNTASEIERRLINNELGYGPVQRLSLRSPALGFMAKAAITLAPFAAVAYAIYKFNN